MDVYKRLEQLGVELPKPAASIGLYKHVVQYDKLLFVSGQGNIINGVSIMEGKLGSERTIEEVQKSARACAINCLAALHEYLGDLNKIKRVIRIFGLVNCSPSFSAHPKVIDGCSRLMCDIWGDDNGIGVRCAVGTNSLPGNISTEIEFVFELK